MCGWKRHSGLPRAYLVSGGRTACRASRTEKGRNGCDEKILVESNGCGAVPGADAGRVQRRAACPAGQHPRAKRSAAGHGSGLRRCAGLYGRHADLPHELWAGICAEAEPKHHPAGRGHCRRGQGGSGVRRQPGRQGGKPARYLPRVCRAGAGHCPGVYRQYHRRGGDAGRAE